MKHLNIRILFVAVLVAPTCRGAAADDVKLFDGQSLAGWTALPGGTWEVVDGAIVGKSPASERRHGILLSDAEYDDFEVTLKFRVHTGDSGFYFRSEPVRGSVGVNGFQVEVDTSQETGGLYETGGRAWVTKPTPEARKQREYKPGEWTDLKLRAVGGDVTVWINGVVSADLHDDPGRRKGHFGLQLHGGQAMHVEFRDIVLKEGDPPRDR